jgi:hypothetical protein
MNLVETRAVAEAIERIKNETNPFQKMLNFIGALREGNIHHTITYVREAIMIEVNVPGEHWEIEFFADGHIETEVYKSNGHIGGDESVQELLEKHWD